VDSRGRLNLNHLEQVCAEGLSLVCVTAANNEIGNIYRIEAIAQIAQRGGIVQPFYILLNRIIYCLTFLFIVQLFYSSTKRTERVKSLLHRHRFC
jgi:hypothetical protein